MTREEASFYLANMDRKYMEEGMSEALDMAIEALEQEPILDKIRAEIEFEVDHRNNMLCAEDVFAILDKYKEESDE